MKGRKMRVLLACGHHPAISVDAIVFGDWAAHRSPHLECRNRWRVSHVPSGCDIAPMVDGLTMVRAIRVASALGERMPNVWIVGLQVTAPTLVSPLNFIAESIIAEAMS